MITASGDGVKSVTSSTTGICTALGSTVTYVGPGICTVTAHVASGTNYQAADGPAQALTIGKGSTSTVITCNGAPFAYTGSAVTPCTAAVIGIGFAL